MQTTNFNFELPNSRPDLIAIAKILENEARKIKLADEKTLENLHKEGLENLKNPKIKAVFERLKDK